MRILFAIILVFAFQAVNSQNVAKLRADLKKYEAEITALNKQIKANEKRQSTAATNFKLVSRKIETRSMIIANLTEQIQEIDKLHDTQSLQTITLSKELSQLKLQYTELIQHTYLEYRANRPVVQAGSGSLYSAASRNLYRASFVANQLNKQVALLSERTHLIEGELSKLSSEQQRLSTLVIDKAFEVEKLETEKLHLAKLSKALSDSETDLDKRLKDKQQRLQERQRQIAIAIANDKPAIKPDTKVNKNFDDGAPKLPSPVVGGVVAQRFGKYPNACQPWIIELSNGVDIECPPSAIVKSVHEGDVRAILNDGSDGTTVIIRQGKYFTVYGGLIKVTLKVGDTVKAGQRLGVVNGTDNRLHFEIWNLTQALDPQKRVKF